MPGKRKSTAPDSKTKKLKGNNSSSGEKEAAMESISCPVVDTDSPAFRHYEAFLSEIHERPSEYRIGHSLGLLDEEVKKKTPCVLGIDEAGRGPVLGPMVYACAITPTDYLPNLKRFGLADSKTLAEDKREEILHMMLSVPDKCAYVIHSISPVYITEKMLDVNKTSLNVISHDAAIALIRKALDEGVNLHRVFVDTVGKAEVYEAKLKGLFPQLDICVESKADATYPIVSAASIFAKVTRDRALANWSRSELGKMPADVQIGSGYPGDPITKKYLEMCLDPIYGFPGVVRSSWATALVLMEKHCVAIAWPDEDIPDTAATRKYKSKLKEDKANRSVLSSISNFFSSKSEAKANNPKRQRFFRHRSLLPCNHL